MCTALLICATMISAAQRPPDDHINYVGWDGGKRSAKVSGSNFTIAPNGEWSRASESDHLEYTDWSGNKWSAKLGGAGEHIEHGYGATRYIKVAPNGDWSKAHDTDNIKFTDWAGTKETGKVLASGGFLFMKER